MTTALRELLEATRTGGGLGWALKWAPDGDRDAATLRAWTECDVPADIVRWSLSRWPGAIAYPARLTWCRRGCAEQVRAAADGRELDVETSCTDCCNALRVMHGHNAPVSYAGLFGADS